MTVIRKTGGQKRFRCVGQKHPRQTCRVCRRYRGRIVDDGTAGTARSGVGNDGVTVKLCAADAEEHIFCADCAAITAGSGANVLCAEVLCAGTRRGVGKQVVQRHGKHRGFR